MTIEEQIDGTKFFIALLPYDGGCQLRVQWCWAAVAVGVAKYYKKQPLPTQLWLAKQVFGQDCSDPPGDCADITGLPAGKCDAGYDFGCALCLAGCTNDPAPGNSDFDVLRAELDAGRPVVLSTSDHVIVAFGSAWSEQGEKYVAYWDTSFGGGTTDTESFGDLGSRYLWRTISSNPPMPGMGDLDGFIRGIKEARKGAGVGLPSFTVLKLDSQTIDDPDRGAKYLRFRCGDEQRRFWTEYRLGPGEKLLTPGSSLWYRNGLGIDPKLFREGAILVEIPGICVQAVWQREQQLVFPVGRIPYFFHGSEPFDEEEFWKIARKHVKALASQMEMFSSIRTAQALSSSLARNKLLGSPVTGCESCMLMRQVARETGDM